MFELLGISKGAILGGITGLIHESFIVIKQKKRTFSYWRLFLAMSTSAITGYFAYEIGLESDIPSYITLLATFVLSLNSFTILTILTNPSFFIILFTALIPKIKEEDLNKIREKLEKKQQEELIEKVQPLESNKIKK